MRSNKMKGEINMRLMKQLTYSVNQFDKIKNANIL